MTYAHLLLRRSDVLEKENKRPKVTKCLVWRPEGLLRSTLRGSQACGGKAEKAKEQTQDLIIRGTELEKGLVYYAKIKTLVGKG